MKLFKKICLFTMLGTLIILPSYHYSNNKTVAFAEEISSSEVVESSSETSSETTSSENVVEHAINETQELFEKMQPYIITFVGSELFQLVIAAIIYILNKKKVKTNQNNVEKLVKENIDLNKKLNEFIDEQAEREKNIIALLEQENANEQVMESDIKACTKEMQKFIHIKPIVKLVADMQTKVVSRSKDAVKSGLAAEVEKINQEIKKIG